MTIKATRYVKNDIEMTLEYGVNHGVYYCMLGDVVLSTAYSHRPAWSKGQDAEAALAETGWEKG